MSNSSKQPWWKRILASLFLRKSPANPPIRQVTTTVEPFVKRRVASVVAPQVTPAFVNAIEDDRGWVLDDNDGDKTLGQLRLVKNRVTDRYSIVLPTKRGWFFWTGPHTQRFVPMEEGKMWSSPGRNATLTVARFMANGSSFKGPEKKETKERKFPRPITVIPKQRP